MPVIFNTASAVTPREEDTQYVPYDEIHILVASGLTGSEIVAVHVDAPDPAGSSQLIVKEQEIKMTATDMTVRITGPFAYKLVKTATTGSVMVKQHNKHSA
jgi:hypothetical protein